MYAIYIYYYLPKYQHIMLEVKLKLNNVNK